MLASDLLIGAAAIARHLGIERRAVYYLAERRLIPVVRIGRRIFARATELDAAFSSITDRGGLPDHDGMH